MRNEPKPGLSREFGFGVPSVDHRGSGVDMPSSSVDPLSNRAARSHGRNRTSISSPDAATRASEFFSERHIQHRPVQSQIRKNVRKPLRVMKFGGTSVGDASCINRVVEIVQAAARESHVVVVVSAMSGVTNKLVEAATQSEAGNREAVAAIFMELRKRHDAEADALIHSAKERRQIGQKMQQILQEGDSLCQGTALLRELTLRARDSISSLGERLAAPLVAAALVERGVASEPIDATEVVVTNSCHGAAEPLMDLTRESCSARLLPLLRQGIVPIVTGFIGATAEGVVTTLGRNGSDYSATILGAALDADEVIIWSDVDGVQTVDPRLVPDVRRIPEISYREAAELSYFGAKVLHPKTLRPVMESGTPLWIRNTFSPERPGTKITPTGTSTSGEVKALTAISDVALITVGGPGMLGVLDVLGRTFKTIEAARANVLLISQSSSQYDIRLVMSSALAEHTVEALRREFAQDLPHEKMEHVTLDPDVAIIALVGQNMHGVSGIIGRTFGALDRANVNIVAIAQGSSGCSISFVVAQKDMKLAILSTHREFQLGSPNSQEVPVTSTWERPASPSQPCEEYKL
jgi:aspartokinase/homoserine dehydrogenase 1